ncbi:MAG: T9SS type A sorting domain-containing protein, partial [Flavobacteriales bacterium]|nr:T9SS type A sorting domain-containing protein [Flavobacteriales bacterium]
PVYEYQDECGNAYYAVTCVATDECGNTASQTYYVSIYDETAPVLDNTPGDLTLTCEDEIPAAAVCTATDNCDPNPVITYDEQCYGECPEPGVDNNMCDLVNPAYPAVEDACNYPINWAVVMFNVPSAYKYYQLVSGEFVDNGDGTAHISAVVQSVTYPSGGFIIDVQLEDGMDWTAFDNLPWFTNYKADCIDVGDNYLDWMYFFINNASTFTGWGSFEGSFLEISHAPSNKAYGYQVGVGANNYNENYGSGGWFKHVGTLVNSETEFEMSTNGAGDLAFEHDCCPDYEIHRTWCAEDCTGNMTCWTQIITIGEGVQGPLVTEGGQEVAVKPIEGNFDIVSVSPNPAKDQTTIEFSSKVNTTLTMDVFDMSGRKIGQLYYGVVEAGQSYKVSFDTNRLEDGIYNVRLFSTDDAKVKRLIIAR